MNVLVTGGAGFIGSHIVEYHLQKGDAVWAVDNFCLGRQQNIQSFLTNTKFRLTEADMCTWPQLQEAASWADRIYHMAAILGQKYVVTHPVEVLSINIKTCEMLLKSASSSSKKPQILIASSSGVYGERKGGLFQEEAQLKIEPLHFQQENYSISKMVGEMLALSYVHTENISCVIARIFNTIGPRQTGSYGMVVPSFIKQALQGKPITVYGNGKQIRSFCHVHDTIQAMDLLLSKPSCHGQIVNIGNDKPISILELAELIKAKTKSSSPIVHMSYKEAYGIDFTDIQNRQPLLDKLVRLTGFTPQISLEQTIDEVITSFKPTNP